MLFPGPALTVAVALITASTALPQYGEGLGKRYDGFPDDLAERLGAYVPPGPDDSRGPCPALNTLANHGLINHDGKNLNSNDILAAFPRGFGIDAAAFAIPLHNFQVVCEYIKGSSCAAPANDGTFILTNLTILAEPHAFEHDHSFSRQDYMQDYAHGGITDNIYFNSTQMQNSLDVVSYTPSNPPVKQLADYQDFQQIRLQRESQQNQADFPGTFQQNIPPTLFEVGFIFGATFDRNSTGCMIGTTPQVRLDWWNFWFSEESFPTQLGWVPASTEVFNFDFITSVSKNVLAATVTSTPTSLPSGALATTFPPLADLPDTDPNPTYPLFQGTAYVAPTAPAAIQSEAPVKRAEPAAATETVFSAAVLSHVASAVTASPDLLGSVTALVGPAPSKYDLYMQKLDVSSLQAQVALAHSYEAAIFEQITSLAK